MEANGSEKKSFVERIISGIGSPISLVIHTIAFLMFFILSLSGLLAWNIMLLILTTIVSLEAIYLAIFIQMTVNRQARHIEEVSEDIDEIQGDIDEIQEDVEDIQEDIDEIQEDVEEISEEEEGDKTARSLDQLSADVRKILEDIEKLKRGQV
jgi:uncharacterized protein YoxC